MNTRFPFVAALALLAVSCKETAEVEYITSKDGIEFQKTWQRPESITLKGDGTWVLDFGKAAFGQLELKVNGSTGDTLTLHLGECISDGLVERKPGGSRRYRRISLPLEDGCRTYRPEIAKDARNTRHPAVLMPEEVGEVTPFRYVEINGLNRKPSGKAIRRIMVTCPFDDDASYFHSSDEALNTVWDLCKYSIKATTYTGYYVDGDRERICYEADALINQLGHYAVDARYDVARRSFERLLELPTWPTEWSLQMVMVAWYDYLYTGSKELISKHFDALKAHALFALQDSGTGLITSRKGQTPEFLASIARTSKISDIVDWPHSGTLGLAAGQGREGDGYVYTDFNTVVNAYHYQAARCLSKIAEALGRADEARELKEYSDRFYDVFNAAFLDRDKGIYRDGIGTDHSAMHANMFPLAFGLVPDEYRKSVADFVDSRGMACSVYGSQFLLDALYEGGQAQTALDYMTSDAKRGWLNMLREGSTITMEAWGNEFKPNQDWNHAWGAAPADIIPMRLLGVRPLLPAFELVEIRPQIASLEFAEGLVPCCKGGIRIKVSKGRMELDLPDGVKAAVYIPLEDAGQEVSVNGEAREAVTDGSFLKIVSPLEGSNLIRY